ncbi:MAG: FAD/NAD(P)-binding protein [Burkholderiaceae bacterium]
MTPALWRVLERRAETADVCTMAIAPPDGQPVSFLPGQFNMVYVFGVGEIPISIAGDPADHGRIVHTTRAVGAVSRAVNALQPGDSLGVRGPFGAAWPLADQRGRHLLFVAGGLGLAPLRPAVLAARAAIAGFAAATLVVGARSPELLIYRELLDTWPLARSCAAYVTVDHAGPGWTGRVGVVTQAFEAALAGTDPALVTAFVCGPEIMMRFAARDLAMRGVPVDRIWISMERNMKCALGLCGHCQFGSSFVCRDGPVLRWDHVSERITRAEV